MSDTTGSPGPAQDGPGAGVDEPTISPAGAGAPEPPTAAADSPPVEMTDDTPVEPPGVATEQADQAMQPVAVPGDQIEWQPVSTGDAITWQPVVSSSDEGTAAPEWQDADPLADAADSAADAAADAAADEPDAWTAAGAAGAALASNGAAGAGFDPQPLSPRQPAGSQSVAARRRAASGGSPPATPAGRGGDGSGSDDGGQAAKDKTRRQIILLSAATVGVVVIAVVAFLLSRSALDEGDQAEGPGTTPTSVRTAPTLAPTEFQGYRDEAVGFSLRYPKTWVKYVPPASDMRLAVAIQPPDTDGFWVRVLPIQTEANEENIGNFKAVTDTVVFGDGSAKLIQEQLVRVNGRLAYYYLYTFEDEATRNEGIHAHYFIFDGLRIFSLVFQSIPADDFTRQAGIFDQVAESFVPEAPRPGATTTTPPTTTG